MTRTPGLPSLRHDHIHCSDLAGAFGWVLPYRRVMVSRVGTSSPTVAAPNGIYNSLIEHYDGQQWQVTANPLPATTDSGLNAITTTGTTSWAVGSSANHPEGVVLRTG